MEFVNMAEQLERVRMGVLSGSLIAEFRCHRLIL